MTRDPMGTLARVARSLEACGIPYFIGGSVASTWYGIPRLTQDVDLVVDLGPEHVAPLVAALENDFYIDAAMIHEAIEQSSSFNVIHFEEAHKVDLFVLQSDPWSRGQIARCRREIVDIADQSITLAFCSPEDIVLRKLEWFRMGGGISDRQWNDVLGVLKVQSTALDIEYLRHWARELGLTDLLDEAFGDAGMEPA
jgi:hypothetical protein